MKTQEAFETPQTMHSLDNPIWNSLSTLHAHFAEGDELAKRYPPEVTLLAGMPEPTSEAFASLAKTLQRAGAALFLDQPPQIPAGWITSTRRRWCRCSAKNPIWRRMVFQPKN